MRFIIVATALLAATPSFARSSATCHETAGTYVNISGHTIHRPECVSASTHLRGETAICRDGSHSMSEHHAGTCSHHGGVAQWE